MHFVHPQPAVKSSENYRVRDSLTPGRKYVFGTFSLFPSLHASPVTSLLLFCVEPLLCVATVLVISKVCLLLYYFFLMRSICLFCFFSLALTKCVSIHLFLCTFSLHTLKNQKKQVEMPERWRWKSWFIHKKEECKEVQ